MKQLASAAALALAALPTLAAAQAQPVLPANADVWVTLAQEVSSSRMKAGQSFPVFVSRDVTVDGQVAIPRGTPGVGEVTWRTGRGAFGKSGKLEIELRSLTLNGRTLPVSGHFRQEGEGNTGATVGTILVAGVVAGAFVTGHSAVFQQGRELRAVTAEALPLGSRPLRVAAAAVPMAVPAAPVVVKAEPLAVQPAPVAVAAASPVVRPVAVALAAPVPVGPGGPTDAERYQQKLAAANGVHGREPRLGWTITD